MGKGLISDSCSNFIGGWVKLFSAMVFLPRTAPSLPPFVAFPFLGLLVSIRAHHVDELTYRKYQRLCWSQEVQNLTSRAAKSLLLGPHHRVLNLGPHLQYPFSLRTLSRIILT